MRHSHSTRKASMPRHALLTKITACLLLIATFSGSLHTLAQGLCTTPRFAPVVGFSSGSNSPASLVAGDFNNDGKKDLAVANPGLAAGNIGVLLGNGNGVFAPVATYPTGGKSPRSLSAADFNNDGILDLLFANYELGTDAKPNIGVLLGKGDGSFVPVSVLENGTLHYSLVIGDFNGDGKKDIAAIGSYSIQGDIALLLGKGNGSFEPATYFSGGSFSPEEIATADFNNDGILDLAVTSFDVVSILPGNGNGSFAPAVNNEIPPFNTPVRIVTNDFNMDGKLDLAYIDNSTRGRVGMLLGKGDGSLVPTALFFAACNGNKGTHMDIATGDFNGDGKPDLAVVNDCDDEYIEQVNTFAVLLGNGGGGFADAIFFPFGNNYPISIATADFNGDQKLDIALGVTGVPSVLLSINLCGSDLQAYYRDADGDGYGNPNISVTAATQPEGYVKNNSDCNDSNPAINPAATEVCDGVDNNCNGLFDVDAEESDEVCDGVDNDCNGVVDDLALYNAGMYLVNATTGKDIKKLEEGDVIDLSALSNIKLTVRVNAGPSAAGSIVFALQGPISRTHTENLFPYALFGDDTNGNYYGAYLPVGDYTLTATPYCGIGGRGTKGIPYTIRFKVVYDVKVADYTLVNANTDKDIMPLKDGDVIDLATLPPGTTLNIRANTDPAATGSTVFTLSGAQTRHHIENNAPYALYANNNTDYFPWLPLVGSYTLTAVPRSNTGGSGAEGTPLTIRFSIVYSAKVTSFTLVNATTNQDIKELNEGDVIDLTTLPHETKLNIRANTSPVTIGSVMFDLQGQQAHKQTENLLPYALFGDDTKGRYYGVPLPLGDFTLTATPYSIASGTGANGTPLTIHFTVKQTGSPGCTTPNFKPVVIHTDDYSDPVNISTADFNKDGRLDVVVLNGSAVDILLGKGDGGFEEKATYYLSGYSYRSLSTSIGDFNRDGNLDLAISSYDPSSIEILLGNGDGSFVSPITYPHVGKDPRFLNAGDFNNDSKLDLALISRNGIELWMGNGDGSFAPPIRTGEGDFFALAAGDFNNDNELDLAFTYYLGGGGVMLGDGTGRFAPPVTYPGNLQLSNLIITHDFNKDGKLDLAIGSLYHNKVGVLPGKGDGSFLSMITYTSGIHNSTALAAGDFNLDGKEDLAVTSPKGPNEGIVGILLGDNNGRLAPPVTFSLGDNYPSALTTGDFNKDGKKDLAIANSGVDFHAYLSVLLNTCEGSLPPAFTQVTKRPLTNAVEVKTPRLDASPNPFSYQTTIRFATEKTGFATLGVFNASGIEITRLYQGQMEAGREYRRTFEGKGLPAGVYIVRLATQKDLASYKVVLIH